MKEKILKCLREAEDYVSGQELCRMLDVSRTAIWKVMNQLKDEGYVIDAVKNKGYKLIQTPDLVTAEEVDSLLETEWAGHPVVYEEEPEGTSVMMSILLRPQIHPMSASMLTLVAAMAVYDAISSRVEGCAIKWPNDIVINGRKVCGILTEMSSELDNIHYVVIGIGINVNTDDFPEDIAAVAASMHVITGEYYKRAEIIADVWKAFEKYYDQFLQTENLSLMVESYNQRLVNMGRKVYIEERGSQYEGTACGIDSEGALLVEKTDGTRTAVISGEVSVRGVLGYV